MSSDGTDLWIFTDISTRLTAEGHRARVLAAESESVRFFSVDGVITDQEHFFGHTERNTKDIFDEVEDERGHYKVETDDEESANDLQPHLFAIASDGTAWRHSSERGTSLSSGEDTDEESTKESCNSMCVEDIQRIINDAKRSYVLLTNVQGNPWNGAGAGADDDCSPPSYNTGSRSDGDQTSDHALHSANHSRFLVIDDVHNGPNQIQRLPV